MNCRNCARDLDEAISSVLGQTEQDFEIVFYDNCSTDESAQIAQSAGDKLRYVAAEQCLPLGAARNRAIAQSRGEFIAFLDCDDVWHETKIEKQLACFAKNPNIGLVTTDTVFLQDKLMGKRLFASTTPARGRVFAELLERQWISMSSAMIRRTALPRQRSGEEGSVTCYFDEQLEVCEEADLFYRIAHDWDLDFVDEPLTQWRIHGNNTTFRKFGKFADETLLIADKLEREFPDCRSTYAEALARVRQRAIFQRAIDQWRRGESRAARASLSAIQEPTPKHRLFALCTYLPGSCFDLLAGLYFSLPSWLRR